MPEQRPEPSWTPAMPSGSDPSALTMQLILREVAALDKVLTERMNGVMERISATDTAHELFRNDLMRVPTAVDKAVGQLKELHEKWFLEKFAHVEQMLRVHEQRMAQLTQALRDVESRCAKAIARVDVRAVPGDLPPGAPAPE